MECSPSAKFLILVGAFTLLCSSALADDQGQMSSNAEPSVIPSFEQVGIQSEKFDIKFANLHSSYNMAIFETDKDLCEDAFLFVFIPSRPISFELREAMRSSWAGDGPSSVVVRFIIGAPRNSEIFYLLLGEQNIYGDLILYDIEDTYENLYLKVHAAFQWQQKYCSRAEYILKADDDTIVDLHRLLYWTKEEFAHLKQTQPAIIFGAVWKGSIPYRNKNHKWYVSEDVYPSRRFPDYVNGATYLMSNEAISTILSNTREQSAFPLEDVLYTGVISEKTDIQRVDILKHFRRGDKVQRREPCKNQVPLLTALYGRFSVKEFARKYQILKTISCDSFKKF